MTAVPEHEYRTLRYVRGEVQSRVGFANQISGLSPAIWNSFVREAHRELFLQLKVGEKRTTTDLSMVVDQVLYDFPAGVDYRRIAQIYTQFSDYWHPLERTTIDWAQDSLDDVGNYPLQWDVKDGQFEVWPKPDDTYTVRFDYYPEERYLRSPSDWVASTAYVVGDYVVATTVLDYPSDWPIGPGDSDTVDCFVYKCTVAGTSHSSEPTWPLVAGNTVSDNTVTWTCVENRMQVPSHECMQLALTKAKSHYKQEDANLSLQAAQLNIEELRRGETRGIVYRRALGKGKVERRVPNEYIPPKRV
jgi:hypothetical protein